VLWSFAYLMLCRLFELAVLLGRSERSKELEILVLRHELVILRRQASRPQARRVDRMLLAALSRSLPRSAWTIFSVSPRTLLRWHARLVARRWTYPHKQPGRPPLERRMRELVLRLARENPNWDYQRIAGDCADSGSRCRRRRCARYSRRPGCHRRPSASGLSWRRFLRQQAAAVLACDFSDSRDGLVETDLRPVLHLA
jgi:putative transposase